VGEYNPKEDILTSGGRGESIESEQRETRPRQLSQDNRHSEYRRGFDE